MEKNINPFHKFVAAYARLLKEAVTYPPGVYPHGQKPSLPSKAPVVLLFSPHPDDECINGALALRLLREMKMKVINVLVTLGSKKERRPERLAEVSQSCKHLGFSILTVSEGGLEKMNAQTRQGDPGRWQKAVGLIAAILKKQKPLIIFYPHLQDANSTHIGTHFLINDALQTMPAGFSCWTCETEYWAPMADPNLMIESNVADMSDLVTSTSFHVGEVSRNPYHVRLPAWMEDNVRRGSELIGGQGCPASDFIFATLYRLKKWSHGKHEDISTPGRLVSCNDSLQNIFG